MLDKPIHGWSRITIGSWSDRCSYIDDVLDKLCSALTNAITNQHGICYFDAEGYEYILVFDKGLKCVHILTHDENAEWKYQTVECPVDELALEFASDVIAHIDDWAEWFDSDLSLEKRCQRYVDISKDCLRLVEMVKREVYK